MYFSKSIKNYNNAAVEYNDNSLEYNNNFEEDHNKNFINDQCFYIELLQEGIELPNTTYNNTINIKAGDTFFLEKL
ncbi:hypothetical protein F8M41_025829 [Gigaspora margarita]|uniref:Uncharacterized protein n=1 Tax=Gigaspora margarita TaxID=4874 RepID=A0A8H3XJI3_GIGMA|nr:hypothetical protein F8M41_025829 [Gigaspora margarita]